MQAVVRAVLRRWVRMAVLVGVRAGQGGRRRGRTSWREGGVLGAPPVAVRWGDMLRGSDGALGVRGVERRDGGQGALGRGARGAGEGPLGRTGHRDGHEGAELGPQVGAPRCPEYNPPRLVRMALNALAVFADLPSSLTHPIPGRTAWSSCCSCSRITPCGPNRPSRTCCLLPASRRSYGLILLLLMFAIIYVTVISKRGKQEAWLVRAVPVGGRAEGRAGPSGSGELNKIVYCPNVYFHDARFSKLQPWSSGQPYFKTRAQVVWPGAQDSTSATSVAGQG